MSLPDKDKLIKELNARADASDNALEEATRPSKHYVCAKCNRPVQFNFIMHFIKDSGLCPNCYHENVS